MDQLSLQSACNACFVLLQIGEAQPVCTGRLVRSHQLQEEARKAPCIRQNLTVRTARIPRLQRTPRAPRTATSPIDHQNWPRTGDRTHSGTQLLHLMLAVRPQSHRQSIALELPVCKNLISSQLSAVGLTNSCPQGRSTNYYWYISISFSSPLYQHAVFM